MFLGNTAGNNAFLFTQSLKKIFKNIKEKTIFKSKFRESRNKAGDLDYLDKKKVFH